MRDFAMMPRASRFRLANARLPRALGPQGLPDAGEGLAGADLVVDEGRIEAILPQGTGPAGLPSLDLDQGLVLPTFTDIHTHLDKGQIWPRAANPDGTFAGALASVLADREAHWSARDVAARMEFSLRCAHAHGTAAIRTHIDSRPGQNEISWPVFAEARARWAGRIALEASPLFTIDSALDSAFMASTLAAVAAYGSGILGAVTFPSPVLRDGVRRLFRIAEERGWALDFHVDESLDPAAQSLRLIAETAREMRFAGPILAGHCCSLAVQPEAEAARTMDLVAEAGIGVVSLPMCNLYLQDRAPGSTPRRRGVTLLHELKARGVPVMIASDNARDPFYAYGDMDGLEVFRETVRIAHLDHPHGGWIETVTTTPARWMGRSGGGGLAAGNEADLILFRARTFNELFSRPQADRIVLRAGRAIDRDLPDYRELDAVFAG